MRISTTRLLLCTLWTLGVCLAACSDKSDSSAEKTADSTATARAKPADSLVITLIGSDSVSVLDILTNKHEVEVHESAMGSFVKAIDSIENKQGYFWLYTVNNGTGKVAADRCLTRDGDTIRWHYRKIGE